MGATCWVYFTPYQSNIAQAFDNLRSDVFAKGQYYKPWEQEQLYREKLLATPAAELSEVDKDLLRNWDLIERDPPPDPLPGTIEDLIAYNAESGTHSILDIEGVFTTSEYGKAEPISETVLVKCFGSTRPSREQVEENFPAWDEYVDRLERWSAVYFAVFKDDQPHELVFAGCSGD